MEIPFYHFHGLKTISGNEVHPGPYRLPLALKKNVYKIHICSKKTK